MCIPSVIIAREVGNVQKGRAMTTHSIGANLAEGMEVLGPRAEHVGEIKEVRAGSFVIRRTLQPQVELPYGVIASVTDDAVHLTIGAEEVDERYWMHAGENMHVETKGEYD